MVIDGHDRFKGKNISLNAKNVIPDEIEHYLNDRFRLDLTEIVDFYEKRWFLTENVKNYEKHCFLRKTTKSVDF